MVLYVRQEPQPLTVDAALAQFRQQTPNAGQKAPGGTSSGATATSAPLAGGDGSQPLGPARGSGAKNVDPTTAGSANQPQAVALTPAEGVYSYDTSGYEYTNAVSGSRHDYPAQTAITIRRSGCGWTERWQPLKERWDEARLCNEGDAVATRQYRSYHEFFQKSQEQTFDCPPGNHIIRDGQQPGAKWAWACSNSSGRIDSTTTFIGTEPMTVGGSAIDVEHFRFESVMTGANRGTQTQDRWVHRATKLTVKVINNIDAEADSPFGVVNYEERYTITLTSLQPRT